MTTDHGPAAVWTAIAAIGLVTYGFRLSFIYLFGRVDDVPEWLGRVLRLVPAAVLAALVAPAIVTVGPTVPATVLDARLAAGAIAAAVAWRTESVFATIAAGMVALWTIRFLL
jgi:branched-subunit amino acid transport protein